MQVNPINENSFKGIKLSSNNYERTKNIISLLPTTKTSTSFNKL